MRHTLRFGFLALVLLSLFALIQPSASLAGQDERVIIEFAPGSGAAVRAELARAGGQVHYRFDRINAVAVTLPSVAIEALRRNPNVVSIEADVPRYPASLNAGQTVPWGIDAVQAPQVWDADPSMGEGVTICIIDSGLYTGHEDLAGISVSGPEFSDWDTDLCGHGTHVAGTIAARDNLFGVVGVVGVAPGDISLFIVKVFGDDCSWAYSSTLVHASEECYEAGADIISMSLGGEHANNAERRQFVSLYERGMLSIAAAGNDGNTAYSYPASYDSVVSVAAIDNSKEVADFSQQNDQVELAAPGVSVESTVPWIATAELTVTDVIYSGGLIEFAAVGTAADPLAGIADGPLVDGGSCDATDPDSFGGAIVLCERSDITFYEKVVNVQSSGGAAAVIYNNIPGPFSGTLGEGNTSEIPAISLSQEDGRYLVGNELGANGDLLTYLESDASGYEFWGGTSMATPHVSAVAALLWSADPSLSNVEIRTLMTETALDLGDSGRDVEYGYGLVQAYEAWEDLPKGGGEPITLLASGYKLRGIYYADLTWDGAAGAKVLLLRNGDEFTVPNSGQYTDNLGRSGRGTYTYRICEINRRDCSNEVTISF